MEPLLILMLAWALGAVVNELQTSVFLSSMLGGSLSVKWLPAIATLLAGLVSFASGSAMVKISFFFFFLFFFSFLFSYFINLYIFLVLFYFCLSYNMYRVQWVYCFHWFYH